MVEMNYFLSHEEPRLVANACDTAMLWHRCDTVDQQIFDLHSGKVYALELSSNNYWSSIIIIIELFGLVTEALNESFGRN